MGSWARWSARRRRTVALAGDPDVGQGLEDVYDGVDEHMGFDATPYVIDPMLDDAETGGLFGFRF